MRPRDTSRLESGEYDLLVLGGGIYGLAIAYEAASRGLRTALVEASDFGSGASFNHQKTVHGGLRSLRSARVRSAREAIRERRALARIAPWFLRPIPFLVGTYRSVLQNRVALRAAFRAEAWLARRRNEGLEPELHLPAPRLISRAATLRLFPGIRQDGLTGGAQWYDYQIVESERVIQAFAAAADLARADLANHVAAVSALASDGRIVGMRVRDVEADREFEIRAKVTINATGSRAAAVMALFGVTRPVPLLKAMNLVTARPANDIALAAPTRSGRMLTLVPWRGHAIVGTSHSESLVDPDALTVTHAELDAFVAEANEAFPALNLRREDVRLVHRGAVPAETGGAGRRPDLKSIPEIRDHAKDGVPGGMTVIGVKFTTARGVAERAVDAAARALGRSLPRSRTAVTPLPAASIADHEALAIETARAAAMEPPGDVVRHLTSLYAESAAAIIRLVAERAELGLAVAEGCRTLAAEVVHAIRHEMAVRLSDIVVRRTGVGSAGHPGADAIRGCGSIAARELGWSEERLAREIADVEAFYRIP